jgi:D-3-phosphoglycerate dehydrogenase
MKKIHCLNPIAACGTDLFPADYEMTDNKAEADAFLVRSASMHEMELPEGLLAVGRAGAGVNNIPLDECAKAGVVVFNTPGANANGVKELVLAGMFLASRDIVGGIKWCQDNAEDENIAKTTEKSKKAFAGWELKGKKLGVIGLGAIGAEVANAATHLGMEVYGYDPYISVNAAWRLSRNKAYHQRGYYFPGVRLYHRSCAAVGVYQGHDQQRKNGYDEGWRGDLKLCKRYSCK